MKPFFLALTATTVLSSALHGVTTFEFENSNLAQTSGTPLPTSVTIQQAYWETEDELGDPLAIPGFRADVNNTPTASDPSLMGYGTAISGNALDGTNGPVMFTFASALNLSAFHVNLDNSTFGNIPQTGANPAFSTNILFYDAQDNLIGFIALDQTVAGFTVNDTKTYNNISKIILPSGAYYDNLSFNAEAVPEPSSVALGCLGALSLIRRRRA